jgi:hypothetical protein
MGLMAETVTCAHHKKTCYAGRDAAYAERRRMADRTLHVYPCDRMRNVFHLGHRDGLGPLLRLERAMKRRAS